MSETAQEANADVIRSVVFDVRQTLLAVPVELVSEIFERAEWTPLPGAPGHIPGLCSLRGVAIPVLDLGTFLDLGEGTVESGFERVMLTESEHGLVGVICDRVLGVLQIEPGEDAVATTRNATLAAFTTGEGAVRDQVVNVLDLKALLAAARVGA